ncbi:unnamed protein product [Gulo gulo]|uniref:Pre T-cell antigen receptor alpha n=1 Tax=Gulo gulo TaxID=48420 RepID=A0A9X9Q7W9_GULGU|nr:unnamed protein product [Gulo gulo]
MEANPDGRIEAHNGRLAGTDQPPTGACSLAGVGGTPFPSLAPPITLLVDGKQQTLVVCLVLDVAPPGFGGPIWFSAGNGSSLDAFTYGPSPEADGTWTSLAQLSLPSEELEAWENLVCHTGPEAGDRSQSTRPLQLSGRDGAGAPVDAPCPSHTRWKQDMLGDRAGSHGGMVGVPVPTLRMRQCLGLEQGGLRALSPGFATPSTIQPPNISFKSRF